MYIIMIIIFIYPLNTNNLIYYWNNKTKYIRQTIEMLIKLIYTCCFAITKHQLNCNLCCLLLYFCRASDVWRNQ